MEKLPQADTEPTVRAIGEWVRNSLGATAVCCAIRDQHGGDDHGRAGFDGTMGPRTHSVSLILADVRPKEGDWSMQ